jgi:hypothetical protein
MKTTLELRNEIEKLTLAAIADEVESTDYCPSAMRDGMLADARQKRNHAAAYIDALLLLPGGVGELKTVLDTIQSEMALNDEKVERLSVAMEANRSTGDAPKINAQQRRLASLEETRRKFCAAIRALKSRLQSQPAAT